MEDDEFKDEEDEIGVSMRDLNVQKPANMAPEEENESFLRNEGHHKSSTFFWSPCRLLLTLFFVFFLTGIAIYTTISLDQQLWQQKPVLRFQAQAPPVSSLLHDQGAIPHTNWTFRIMQITDIHLGEDEFTDWGPEQDVKTFKLLDKMFAYEQPHLVVMGGDQLTANNCQHNCTAYYELLGQYLTLQGIPWATIMGNHDDMPFEVSGSKETIPHEYTRRELLAVDEAFQLSLTQTGPPDVTGASNYVLDIMGSGNDNEAAVQIFFLDSGGGTLPESVDDSRVQWFKQAASLRQDLPAVAFQHIPTHGHLFDVDTCTGYEGQHIPELYYTNLVDAMVETGRFHFLGVGHTHGNDYCCPYQKQSGNGNNVDGSNLYFCFGRHSGYGGYGSWQRGVRMYELSLSPKENGFTEQNGNDAPRVERDFKWRSWVRLESGAYVDFLDYDHIPMR